MSSIEKIKKYPEEIALVIIILIGAVLRFHHLGITSLSNDELSALIRTRFSSFSELIDKGVAVDGHPAFVQVLLFYWIKIFGDGIFSIRFPFAIAGIISILYVYLLGKKWVGKATGLFAAAALSTLQFPLLYSQTARPYVFGMLFTLIAAYYWSVLLFEKDDKTENKKRKLTIAAYILSMSACMYTHYFSFLEAGIMGITGLFFLRKNTWKEYLFSGVLIILLFIPHLSIFIRQLNIGGIGFWLPKPDHTFLRTFLSYCFNNSDWLFILCLVIFVLTAITFTNKIKLNRYHWISLAWFLLPFFIGYYYSVYKNPVLQYSTLIFGFPFLLLFVFSFIPSEAVSKKTIILSSLIFLLISGYSTVIEKQFYQKNHFGVFKELAEDAVKWSDQYGDKNMLKVISVLNPEYIHYYFDRMGRNVHVDQYKADEEQDVARLMAMVDTSQATYLLYGWTNIAHPLEAEKIITDKFPVIAERDSFFNSEITLYKRDSTFIPQNMISFSTDFEENHFGEEVNRRTDELAYSGKFSQKMDEQTEYSVGLKKKTGDFSSVKNPFVTATVWVNSKDTTNDAVLVLCFEENGNNIEWYGANLQSFNLKPGAWQKLIISKPVPEGLGDKAMLNVYVWNKNKKTFFVDDFEVRVEGR
ncbi:MAG: glycosyltransferase family 39 protein [Bacteroidetes bacterium]|nr:glycosyltransferase family 39 protein [Bacteroidota bacterium]